MVSQFRLVRIKTSALAVLSTAALLPLLTIAGVAHGAGRPAPVALNVRLTGVPARVSSITVEAQSAYTHIGAPIPTSRSFAGRVLALIKSVRPRILIISVAAMVAAAGTAIAVIEVIGGQQPGVLSNGSPPGYTTTAGVQVGPGQVADFAVTVQNNGSAPVTLLGARLVPVPGFRAPRLVHVGVLAEHTELIGENRGWPVPRDPPASGFFLTRPVRGYIVLPWKVRQSRHLGPMPDMIEYGVLGAEPNNDYVAAGLDVTYRFGNGTYSQVLYSGGDACVLAVNFHQNKLVNARYQRYCAATDNRAWAAVDTLAKRAS